MATNGMYSRVFIPVEEHVKKEWDPEKVRSSNRARLRPIVSAMLYDVRRHIRDKMEMEP